MTEDYLVVPHHPSLITRHIPCHDREAHRAHQTHLVDLFSHVNFHFYRPGFHASVEG